MSKPLRFTRPLPNSYLLAIIAVLLLAWAVRLYRLDFQDIWWDEARNIDVATRPLLQVAIAPELDIHPPGYFYALKLWMAAAGATAFAARYFSAWFGLLTVALMYRLGRGLASGQAGRRAGTLALILAAAAPYALAEAQETRMYTFSWALLAAAMLILWRVVGRGRRGAEGARSGGGEEAGRASSLFPWAPFVLLGALVLLTHYATAIILTTWGLWLLGWALLGPDRRRRLWMLIGVAGGITLLCLPVVPIALRQIPGYDNPNLTLPNLQQYLSELFHDFTLGEFAPARVWAGGRWLWLLLPAVGAGLWRRWGHSTSVERQRRALLLVWLLGGLTIFYLILVARSAFDPRYISFVLPALWALAGWALAGWGRIWRGLPWLAVAGIIVVSAPSLRADLLDESHFREDMRGVTAYLRAEATSSDIILVDQRYPFGFYWPRWNNEFYGFPPAQPADLAPAQYLFVDINHIDERLTSLAAKARSVFWVTWFESDMDPRGAVTALLDRYGRAGPEQRFRGYTVRRWDLQPPMQFRLASEFVALGQRFQPGVELVEGDWIGRTDPAAAAGTALVTLRWRADGPTARPLKVSLRLKDANEATVAQDDRLLLNDRHLRTTQWSPGETALNVYTLVLPAQAGAYTLTLVVYDEETLEAVGLTDGSGIEPVIGLLRVNP